VKLRNVRRWIRARLDFVLAKRRLQSSQQLTDAERRLVEHVSLQFHVADGMYERRKASHYLSAGLSASRCISAAMRSSGTHSTIETILDFPSGYGRVLRFLRAMFPSANITAAEIEPSALTFCRRAFGVTPLPSKEDVGELVLPQRFDLIWCGSLLTHVDETSASNILRFFHEHLTDRGLCIFTTHGQKSIEWMTQHNLTYGLQGDAPRKVVQEFQRTGYGYADYLGMRGYGISVASRERMLELARAAGDWHETFFQECGWDNCQDVYAFAKLVSHAPASSAR
jgi:SAM-dependent methyltransferase